MAAARPATSGHRLPRPPPLLLLLLPLAAVMLGGVLAGDELLPDEGGSAMPHRVVTLPALQVQAAFPWLSLPARTVTVDIFPVELPGGIRAYEAFMQGDISLGEIRRVNGQWVLDASLTEPSSAKERRSVHVPSGSRLWPHAKIPYLFHEDLSEALRTKFLTAARYVTEMTELSVVERTTESAYIYVQQGSGCASYVGRQSENGGQVLLIANWCRVMNMGHEILHAAGFYHEHSRQDRDEYVKIAHENIKPEAQRNFNSVSHQVEDRYNFDSVMHYSQSAFSANGEDTITPKANAADDFVKEEGPFQLGQRTHLSHLDIAAVNTLYSPRCWAEEATKGAKYEWRTTEWTKCTAVCGEAQARTRLASCVDASYGGCVSDNKCLKEEPRPVEQEACDQWRAEGDKTIHMDFEPESTHILDTVVPRERSRQSTQMQWGPTLGEDHTSGSGWYFSYSAKDGDKTEEAYLDVPIGVAASCRLSFWFAVPSHSKPGLELHSQACGSSDPTVLWASDSDEARSVEDVEEDGWHFAIVQVPNSRSKKVRFSGLGGQDGAIAIDDLSIDCSKPKTEFELNADCKAHCRGSGFDQASWGKDDKDCICLQPKHSQVCPAYCKRNGVNFETEGTMSNGECGCHSKKALTACQEGCDASGLEFKFIDNMCTCAPKLGSPPSSKKACKQHCADIGETFKKWKSNSSKCVCESSSRRRRRRRRR